MAIDWPHRAGENDPTMPTVQMAFACEGVAQDPFGKMTFQNVVDQLSAPNFPATTQQIFLVFGLMAKVPGIRSGCSWEIRSPENERIIGNNLADVAFTPDKMGARFVVGVQGLTWPRPGTYVVRLLAREDVLASFQITLTQIQPGTMLTQRGPDQ